jgi:hypothetical protein
VSTYTYTSSERPAERVGSQFPPCLCGATPLILTWVRKGFVSVMCPNAACPNNAGVLCYGMDEAPARWEQFRLTPCVGVQG